MCRIWKFQCLIVVNEILLSSNFITKLHALKVGKNIEIKEVIIRPRSALSPLLPFSLSLSISQSLNLSLSLSSICWNLLPRHHFVQFVYAIRYLNQRAHYHQYFSSSDHTNNWICCAPLKTWHCWECHMHNETTGNNHKTNWLGQASSFVGKYLPRVAFCPISDEPSILSWSARIYAAWTA